MRSKAFTAPVTIRNIISINYYLEDSIALIYIPTDPMTNMADMALRRWLAQVLFSRKDRDVRVHIPHLV
jgi:hypothetical protein